MHVEIECNYNRTKLVFKLDQSCLGSHSCVHVLILTPTVSPGGSVDITELFVIATFDEVVSFTCEAQGGPGNSFQWQRNSTDLPNETSPLLVVNVTRPEDGGEYTCLVSNVAGNQTDTTMLYIVPQITTEPIDSLTRNGSKLSVICTAEGFPQPDYRWQSLQSIDHNGNDGYTVSNRSVLGFNPIGFGDEGFYRCIAFSNPLGGMELQVKSRIITLSGKHNLTL